MSKQKLYLLLVVSVALFATKTWAQESPEEEQKKEPMPEEGGERKCTPRSNECEDDDECCDDLVCKDFFVGKWCEKDIKVDYVPEKIEPGEPIPKKSDPEEPEPEPEAPEPED
ncbi:conotoxin Lv15a-like [Microplitis mediator]|uniref:conotoxin Lv15a-like n=1 Tax=Microplitis mediator TaxID=375433 RepID=UPI0025548AC9|nr:conotoxin Lv15a-like [Microplitis mediator]XP_057322356.1 conotoxin Lv15a-like [Microplitis mediator]